MKTFAVVATLPLPFSVHEATFSGPLFFNREKTLKTA